MSDVPERRESDRPNWIDGKNRYVRFVEGMTKEEWNNLHQPAGHERRMDHCGEVMLLFLGEKPAVWQAYAPEVLNQLQAFGYSTTPHFVYERHAVQAEIDRHPDAFAGLPLDADACMQTLSEGDPREKYEVPLGIVLGYGRAAAEHFAKRKPSSERERLFWKKIYAVANDDPVLDADLMEYANRGVEPWQRIWLRERYPAFASTVGLPLEECEAILRDPLLLRDRGFQSRGIAWIDDQDSVESEQRIQRYIEAENESGIFEVKHPSERPGKIASLTRGLLSLWTKRT